jgi:hypothetical protein
LKQQQKNNIFSKKFSFFRVDWIRPHHLANHFWCTYLTIVENGFCRCNTFRMSTMSNKKGSFFLNSSGVFRETVRISIFCWLTGFRRPLSHSLSLSLSLSFSLSMDVILHFYSSRKENQILPQGLCLPSKSIKRRSWRRY